MPHFREKIILVNKSHLRIEKNVQLSFDTIHYPLTPKRGFQKMIHKRCIKICAKTFCATEYQYFMSYNNPYSPGLKILTRPPKGGRYNPLAISKLIDQISRFWYQWVY